MIGFYTGLRISEAFALTWDDIDFEKRTLSVNKQVVKPNFGADVRKVVEKKGKKNSVHHGTSPHQKQKHLPEQFLSVILSIRH